MSLFMRVTVDLYHRKWQEAGLPIFHFASCLVTCRRNVVAHISDGLQWPAGIVLVLAGGHLTLWWTQAWIWITVVAPLCESGATKHPGTWALLLTSWLLYSLGCLDIKHLVKCTEQEGGGVGITWAGTVILPAPISLGISLGISCVAECEEAETNAPWRSVSAGEGLMAFTVLVAGCERVSGLPTGDRKHRHTLTIFRPYGWVFSIDNPNICGISGVKTCRCLLSVARSGAGLLAWLMWGPAGQYYLQLLRNAGLVHAQSWLREPVCHFHPSFPSS